MPSDLARKKCAAKMARKALQLAYEPLRSPGFSEPPVGIVAVLVPLNLESKCIAIPKFMDRQHFLLGNDSTGAIQNDVVLGRTHLSMRSCEFFWSLDGASVQMQLRDHSGTAIINGQAVRLGRSVYDGDIIMFMRDSMKRSSLSEYMFLAVDHHNDLESLDELVQNMALNDTGSHGARDNTKAGASGWSNLARTVREVDEARIRDCKEDIDTLLVFAGLFSAIMTAFVVESYKGLQQDPATLTVEILQEIAAQTRSYSVKEGSLNATVPQSPAPTPFEPPSSIVHINVLWFASLTFSLITASVAILVKQWLREYLGGEYIGPRARLRIRHFRFPGLATWKVFEIVALLPLFLQLSLGLFLIGLCLFTASIHPSVGYTCIPIITGWALFFVATVVAPVVSPRCPYKTPLVKDLTKYLRPIFYKASYVLERYGSSVLYHVSRIGFRIVGRARAVDARLPSTTTLGYPHPEEEETFAADGDRDLEILVALDTFFADDDIFLTTIWPSLWEMQPSGENAFAFITSVLRERLGAQSTDNMALLPPLDLRSLAPRVHETLIDAVVNLLKTELSKEGAGWRIWKGSALVLLFSVSNSNYWQAKADSICEVCQMYLSRYRKAVCHVIATSRCFSDDNLTYVFLERFCRVLLRYDEGEIGYSVLQEIVGRAVHGGQYEERSFRLFSLLEDTWSSALTTSHIRSLAAIAVDLLQQGLQQNDGMKTGDLTQWMTDASTLVLSSIVAIDSGSRDNFPVYFNETKIGLGIAALLAHGRTAANLWQRMLCPGYERVTKSHVLSFIHTVYLHDSMAKHLVDPGCGDKQTGYEADPIRTP
ncbi:hypothetical protein NM688_g8642 [Phlebia brevispora]|uniref:Uncharacterized protein n=1 Tax=Phlebia brevispora TaxID=194682 RepID=A0ACC1RR64_9APHY|nr:hypothetical protein NM688_g8642 [Phlebia brevispora]